MLRVTSLEISIGHNIDIVSHFSKELCIDIGWLLQVCITGYTLHLNSENLEGFEMYQRQRHEL